MADKASNSREALETEQEDIYSNTWDEANKKIGGMKQTNLSTADNPANVKDGEIVPATPEPPIVETTLPPAATASIPTEIPTEIPAEIPTSPDSSLQQPSESDEKFEQRYKTLQGIHKHDREVWETERAALLLQLEESKKPEIPTQTSSVAAEAFVDSLTDEQKEQLKEYERDFDVVSRMEGIKRSMELAKLRKEIADWKTEVTNQLTKQATQFTSQIAPAIALAEESDEEAHFDLIRNGYELENGTFVPGHNDFEKYRDDGSLLAWIESKPKYLQSSLRETYSKGTATDVIDLISDFKRENNIPLTFQTLASQTTPDNIVPLTSAKAARKQALTTVTTRRGAVNTGGAFAGDYESAWDEANAKQGG